MVESAGPVIERTEVDGVPVFWSDVDGPRIASLMFRVGRADEPPHQGGITHLVEHLALAPLAQQDYGHNGFVSPLRTVFHATGTDEQLVSFMAAVTASLRALPLDRIAMERRILAQEAAGRSGSSTGMVRWYRWGYAGQGLLGAEEVGLSWLGPDPVTAWCAERFTRQNAAVWWTGPPPADLRIDLPDGLRQPVVDHPPVPDVRFPARGDAGGSGASIGFLGTRTAATRVTQEVLVRRLRQDLRFDRGLIYDVGSDYEAIAAETAHLTIGMDCSRDDATEVAGTVLRTLDAIAADGASPDEIEREVADFVQGSTLSGGRMGFLDGTAHDELLGRARDTPAQVIDEYRATTPADTAAVARRALESLLLFAPPGPYDEGRVSAYPTWSSAPVEGRTIRPSGWLIGPKARKDRLVLGREGVSWLAPIGRANTVRYADCVAIRHWEGPVRELWGRDGFRVVVDASAWRGGEDVVREIDAAVPREVVACDEHGIGGLEIPPGAPQPSGTSGSPGAIGATGEGYRRAT